MCERHQHTFYLWWTKNIQLRYAFLFCSLHRLKPQLWRNTTFYFSRRVGSRSTSWNLGHCPVINDVTTSSVCEASCYASEPLLFLSWLLLSVFWRWNKWNVRQSTVSVEVRHGVANMFVPRTCRNYRDKRSKRPASFFGHRYDVHVDKIRYTLRPLFLSWPWISVCFIVSGE
jgi:hypothetical protein